MKHRKKLIALSIFLIVLGAAGMAPTLYYWNQNRAAASSVQVIIPAPQPVPKPTLITGKPVELSVDSINLKLEVADGVYNQKNGQWTLSKNKAHFALLTVQPNNEQGNTLIYGHYRPEVFAKLRKVQPGAEAIVKTDNGYSFVYKFRSSQTVNPADTSIFAYQGAPMLTLQTCTGAWMQNRQLFSFDLTRFEKTQ
jgi:LPXTG-site transpeptidase (sortase) family protein